MATHQVRIFTSTEDNADALEREVNDWLRQSGAKILNILGNIAPQSVVGAAAAPAQLTGAERAAVRRFAPSDILLVIVYEA